MWLLSPSWMYLGLMTGFMLGAYPTSLIFTQCLSNSKTLIPLYAIAMGMGELSSEFLLVGKLTIWVFEALDCGLLSL